MKVFICTVNSYRDQYAVIAESAGDAMLKFIKSPTTTDMYGKWQISPNIEDWEKVVESPTHIQHPILDMGSWRSREFKTRVTVRELHIPDGDCLYLGEFDITL